MSIVGAAAGSKIFFDHCLDKKCCFICQRWVISFDFHWYKIEDSSIGVQFLDHIPYWIDENFYEQVQRAPARPRSREHR